MLGVSTQTPTPIPPSLCCLYNSARGFFYTIQRGVGAPVQPKDEPTVLGKAEPKKPTLDLRKPRMSAIEARV